MQDSKLSILYTEDTGPLFEMTIPFMEIGLDAQVTHTISNGQAADWLFKEGRRFDVYIFDDSALTGGGHGIKIALQLAETLKQEGRKGIIISANSSNTQILTDKEGPITLQDLTDNQVEFWYKHTEMFKMFLWIASCIREGRQIPRAEWLESVGEETKYVVWGRGNEVESKLQIFSSMEPNEAYRGAFFRINIPEFINELRGEKYTDEVLASMLGENGIKGERQQ